MKRKFIRHIPFPRQTEDSQFKTELRKRLIDAAMQRGRTKRKDDDEKTLNRIYFRKDN